MGVSACVWVHELAYAYASGFVEYADYNQLATTLLQRAQYVVVVALNLVLVLARKRAVPPLVSSHVNLQRR
jgi:hypothetical protein